MNSGHIYVLLAIICVLGMIATSFIYTNQQVLQYEEIKVSYEVREGQSLGFDTTNESLAFGRSAPGGKSFRHIEIVSAEPARFFIGLTGDAVQHLHPEPSFGDLEPGVAQMIRFTLSSPEKPGNYTGLVQVRVLRR